MTPALPIATLRKRAQLLRQLREFFSARGVLEIETPILSPYGNPDPHIDSIACALGTQRAYLQTSPEFAMKRLLVQGSGDIFQLCHAFRDGEAGRFHRPEFTLLEWYRLDFDHLQLNAEVIALIEQMREADAAPLQQVVQSYQALFIQYLCVDPLDTSMAQLRAVAQHQGLAVDSTLSLDGWLDLLLSHCIVPRLPANQLTTLIDYPASQAALARLNADTRTAARFEVFWGSLELANGYWELQDPDEHVRRFAVENAQRHAAGQPSMPVDQEFLKALQRGLPDCAGVALGVDRLLMKLLGAESLDAVCVD